MSKPIQSRSRRFGVSAPAHAHFIPVRRRGAAACGPHRAGHWRGAWHRPRHRAQAGDAPAATSSSTTTTATKRPRRCAPSSARSAGGRWRCKASVGLPDSVDEMFGELAQALRPPRYRRQQRRQRRAQAGDGHDAEALALVHGDQCVRVEPAGAARRTVDGCRRAASSRCRASARSRAMPNYAFIGASKAALESLVRALAQELGPRGIRVNAVSAGVVETDALAVFPESRGIAGRVPRARTPAGPVLTPEDVAGAVYLLCLPEAAMINGHDAVRRRRLRDLRLMMTAALDSGLSGKVAIVTGGSRGIGRAIVELLAADGVDVVFFYRGNAEAAAEVVDAVAQAGGKAEAIQVDVADAPRSPRQSSRVVERAGASTCWSTMPAWCATTCWRCSSDEDIGIVLDTNVGGVFNVTRAVVPHMISKRVGANHQPELGRRRERRTRPGELRGEQGRDQRLHARDGGRAGLAQDHGQRVAPGVIETEMSQQVRELAGDEVKSRILLRRYGQPRGSCLRRLVPRLALRRLHHGRNPARRRRIQNGVKGMSEQAINQQRNRCGLSEGRADHRRRARLRRRGRQAEGLADRGSGCRIDRLSRPRVPARARRSR